MANPNHDPHSGEFTTYPTGSGHNAGVGSREVRSHIFEQHTRASGVETARRDLEAHLREILRTRYKQV